jgi:cytidylate kinase
MEFTLYDEIAIFSRKKRISMIIALDGPSGVGKGTLGKALAAHYNLAFLDTGLLYRQVGLSVLRNGADPEKEEEALKAVRHLTLEVGDDAELRTEAVSQAASKIATHLSVREALLDWQRNFAHTVSAQYQGAILDGRDIGTVVLPEADVKIYLTAHTEIRAERRLEDLKRRGEVVTFDQMVEDVKERDKRDQRRKHSPLHPAPDAFLMDTSFLSKEEVLHEVISYIEKIRKNDYS